ncbi:conserved membrane hypothetical protein [Candidatus Sulfotelmatomonas gaucii]|uniref:GGDEF domain-containing protein n=1 Tax=Candidatus Sulfuritelmatomonas gaucii TaxID=2043161 RepID=A0A2N9L327_9BACT|nr:conserved membrane hypothetical protein [Candidatus Sulfotelmatomonas gaucii]
MTPITHPIADVFLLGFIVACSLVTAVFFLKYWRDARDPLFLAFAAFFGIQAIDTSAVLLLPYPNEGDVWLFLMRLLSVLWVLGAILWKNSAKL